MRFIRCKATVCWLIGILPGVVGLAQCVRAGDATLPDVSSDTPSPKDRLISFLPPAVGEGLDVNGWLWLQYLHDNQHEDNNTLDLELSLDVNKTFGKNVAVSFEGNFLDVHHETRFEFEQTFLSILAFDQTQTLVTIGKFNANFGVEARDFWNRTTGTTSLLFGAQPQDLVGVMVTQPLGDSGITLRPFVSTDFQGVVAFDEPPSAGISVQYEPSHEFDVRMTNWIGPGFVLSPGPHLHSPYDAEAYGDSGASIIGNWQGPNLTGNRGGTVYFVNLCLIWRPSNDLTLSAEYLAGATGTSAGTFAWTGAMLLADYDITDHWGVFARASYLDDHNGIITGDSQDIYEISGGVSYRFNKNLELRAEYRHDSGNDYGGVDTFSLHLTAGI